VKRDCFIYKSSEAFKKHIYVDKGNAKDIYNFIKGNYDKFNRIGLRVLETENHYYKNYEKAQSFNKIYEMRFLGNPNGRIYCREVKGADGRFCIVMGKVVVYKKSEKIDKSIKSQLKVLETYEYQI
jgi:hypothetical protein